MHAYSTNVCILLVAVVSSATNDQTSSSTGSSQTSNRGGRRRGEMCIHIQLMFVYFSLQSCLVLQMTKLAVLQGPLRLAIEEAGEEVRCDRRYTTLLCQ